MIYPNKQSAKLAIEEMVAQIMTLERKYAAKFDSIEEGYSCQYYNEKGEIETY